MNYGCKVSIFFPDVMGLSCWFCCCGLCLICKSDVRSCIYGGKLGFPLQDRKRGAQVFTYKELELATDGFSESNVIGSGGFGVVYRGNLSDGTVAAIKLLHREGKQGEREFRMEVIITFLFLFFFVVSNLLSLLMYSFPSLCKIWVLCLIFS